MSALEIGGAFVMGLMGSLHCVAMCGPLAAVLCGSGQKRGRVDVQGLLPQVGRLATYCTLGTLAGLFGRAVEGWLPLGLIQVAARVSAALLLVFVGLYAAGFFGGAFRWFERMTAPLFAALTRRVGASTGAASRLLHGAIWGLVPCGLVYGGLGLAALTGSAGEGALVTLAFGAGTLPAMVAAGLFAEGFRRLVRDRRVRQSAGLLLAVAGSAHLVLAYRAGSAWLAPHERIAPDTQDASDPPEQSRPSCH